jgi:hypothetical protein
LGLVLLLDLYLIVAGCLMALLFADPVQSTSTRVVCLVYIPCSVLMPLRVGWRERRRGASRERAIQAFAYTAFWFSFCFSLIAVSVAAF